jgi:hypothetical protein
MYKKFFRLSFLGSLAIPIALSAQPTLKADDIPFPKLTLLTSFNSWLDYDAGLMLGVNYRWARQVSTTIEPTWIFYNGLVTDPDQYIKPTGIKVRADVRYHFKKFRAASPDFFIGPEFHYKNVTTKKEDQFGINCVNGQCAYFQDAVYKERKQELGGFVKMGMATRFPFVKNDKWLLEFYLGLGAKTLRFKETDLPVGGSFVSLPNHDFLFFGPGEDRTYSVRAMFPAGLKLCYVIRY